MHKLIVTVFLTSLTMTIMAQKEIKTSIDISASPQVIWNVLTNFTEYEKWNPFLKSVEGDFKVGEKVKINAGGMKFRPKVLAYNENKEIRWLGKFIFKGLFDGEHKFIIIDNGDGTSTFKQEEKFSGILVGLFKKKLETETKSGFEEMNKKLKELAENLKDEI
ncbi:MAG: SRPBCC domain-containing protein [Winogradskyella sp.]|uniref:SRPBCC domain-containing protein n=1 Tax=Winogradskyella sp. TaxID=1883156 RepID=UPI000F3AC16E|nr:SRPBCC domain-containing protein [Winogradskyella sp.]RNC87869.1 MAG: SRPBCC domain-containing protein [Winogradskyella sp.]